MVRQKLLLLVLLFPFSPDSLENCLGVIVQKFSLHNLYNSLPVRSVVVSTFNASLISAVQETPRIRSLTFALDKLISFKPGQFVMLVHREQGRVIKRAYSLCSPSSMPNRISLALNEMMNGTLSPLIYHLKKGATVELEGPYGLFTLHDSPRKKVFLAGGTGISPILSMLYELEQQKKMQDVLVIYSAKKEEDILFRKELAHFEHKGAHVVITLTEEASSSWKGELRRIDQAMLEQYVKKPAACDFYVCGSPQMVQSLLQTLAALKVPSEHIHHERW